MLSRSQALCAAVGRLAMAGSVLIVATLTALEWYRAPVATAGESVWAIVSVTVETVGGLALLIGWRTRTAALAMVVWFATLIAQRVIFVGVDLGHPPGELLRDVAVIAGLLMTAAHGAGPWSIDNRRHPLPMNLSDSNVLG